MALGGGFEIVLACDMVGAARSAKFGLPETAPGLITTCGGLFRGWQSLPLTVAKHLVLTGRRLSARGAYELSLVNTLTRDGEALARALELAAQACENSPFAVGESLSVMQDLLDAGEELGLTQTEAATDGIRASEDKQEAVAAFLERHSRTGAADESPGDLSHMHL